LDTITKRFGGESGKDDRVKCPKSNYGEKRDNGLRNHGHVNSDGIALLYTQFFEDVGDFAYFPEQFTIGEVPALAGLVGLINNSNLSSMRTRKLNYAVRIFYCVSIDQVVTGAESPITKPSHVAMREGAGSHGAELFVPGNEILGKVAPELIWVLN